jgi:hypothetical protein
MKIKILIMKNIIIKRINLIKIMIKKLKEKMKKRN